MGDAVEPRLEAAFRIEPDPDRIRLVVFLTDGFIGNESEIFASIERVLGEARIFTLGIGSSVNHHLLRGMARLGRGAYEFIRPNGQEQEAVESFRGWAVPRAEQVAGTNE